MFYRSNLVRRVKALKVSFSSASFNSVLCKASANQDYGNREEWDKLMKGLLYFSGITSLLFLEEKNRSRKSSCEENVAGSALSLLSKNFVAETIHTVAPAVVNIVCTIDGIIMTGESSGSGFIMTEDGFVVTNAHVVAAASDGKVQVTTMEGLQRTGTVHSLDLVSDIALVKLDNGFKRERYPVLSLGSSSKLTGGELVIAVGSPHHHQKSASLGIVSAPARHASELGLSNNRSEYIQTDAIVNFNNSGGPLVDLNGDVVGINTVKMKAGDGISCAVPIDIASQIIKQLMRYKKVTRPYVGLKMANYATPSTKPVVWPFKTGATEKKQAISAVTGEEDAYVLVLDVVKGSPAYHSGLQRGDIIKEANGRPIKAVVDVLDVIGVDVGKKIQFKVTRDDQHDMVMQLTTESELHRYMPTL